MEGGVASTLYAGSLKHSGSFTCVMVIRMSASAHYGCFAVILLSVKRHQRIDSAIPGRYTVQAPYKAGAGIGVLKLITEQNRAHAVFSYHEHRYAQIMVGRTGPTSVGPGSVVSGNANPVRLTTSVIGVPCGEFSKKLTTGAVTMTTLPTIAQPELCIVAGKVVTSSLSVACYFRKQHKNVIQKIASLECSAEFTELNFQPSDYTDASGRKLLCYQITRDGFAFLAMGFTGKRAARFKEAYINAFNQMERSLSGAGAADMSSVAQNARGVYLHLREIHQIWKSQLYPMLNAVESPLASKLYDRVGDAVFGAALVDSRLNGSDKEVRP
ncbi:Rha family transcriptional regulator [Escherichia coli]